MSAPSLATANPRPNSVPSATPERRYTRWTDTGDGLAADILGSRWDITAHPDTGLIALSGEVMNPDEARLIGVRLIEAAALADGGRAVRQRAT